MLVEKKLAAEARREAEARGGRLVSVFEPEQWGLLFG